jgi:hypothetical protein
MNDELNDEARMTNDEVMVVSLQAAGQGYIEGVEAD